MARILFLCRSLPDLEVVGETSLTSILRWNFKTNMDKRMSSSSTGQITMVGLLSFSMLICYIYSYYGISISALGYDI